MYKEFVMHKKYKHKTKPLNCDVNLLTAVDFGGKTKRVGGHKNKITRKKVFFPQKNFFYSLHNELTTYSKLISKG